MGFSSALNYPEVEKRKAVESDNHENSPVMTPEREELFAEIIKLAGVGGGGGGMEDGQWPAEPSPKPVGQPH